MTTSAPPPELEGGLTGAALHILLGATPSPVKANGPYVWRALVHGAAIQCVPSGRPAGQGLATYAGQVPPGYTEDVGLPAAAYIRFLQRIAGGLRGQANPPSRTASPLSSKTVVSQTPPSPAAGAIHSRTVPYVSVRLC